MIHIRRSSIRFNVMKFFLRVIVSWSTFQFAVSTVSWVLDTSVGSSYEPRFYKSVRLICTVTGSACCPGSDTRRWWVEQNGVMSQVLANGISTNASKYVEDLQVASSQFNLVIKDFNIDDVNIQYQCQYNFDDDTRQLQLSDGLNYIPSENEIIDVAKDFNQPNLFSYTVNITKIFPEPNCSCSFNHYDLTANMTTTTGDNGVYKYAVLSLSDVAHTCSGEFSITCTIGSYPNQQVASFSPCSTSSQSESEWLELLPPIIGSVFGVMIMLYIIYLCSNKNCKTHAICWKCSGICYSDYPLAARNLPEEWNVEHYCCSNPCCPIKGCNKKCCSCFLFCGCCVLNFPAKRVKENNQLLTTPVQSSTNDQQGNNTNHTDEEKAVHIATVNDTKSEPNHQGARRISMDSLNPKCNKIFPEEDKYVKNSKILDSIMHKPGNDEITNSSIPQPLPVLPPIDKKKS